MSDYVLSNDTTTLAGDTVAQGAPTYVDAANGDYHLVPSSLGVDLAPAAGNFDRDGRIRNVDLPQIPNDFGPRDLGAYEIQPSCSVADTIYCNGFEDD